MRRRRPQILMNMNLSELINEILSEWAYRVENGMPDPKNPTHLKELGIVLSEMGLSHIKDTLVENLLVETGKTPQKVVEAEKGNFTNPALNKSIKYKNDKGEDKEGLVGNLLRLPKEHPGRKAAEATLPADGTPERDSINKDLGGEGQPKKPEDGKGKEGGEAGGGEDEKMKQAAAMFDPKTDPAMAARIDKEKEVQAKLAKDAEADKETEKAEEPKKDGDFNPIDIKDVAKEMPQADPETFGGDSDIPDGIEPEQLQKFNTDISKVAQQVADAKAKGEPAPNINLCDVTVPGTNLYCDDNLGIPRDQMPQFKGKAQPGTPAADMPTDANGEVDTEPLFKKMLEEKGIKTLQTEIPADKLKATQQDLVGAKVVGMMGVLKDPNHPAFEKITAPIYVSRDGHVIDGHHRWAAIVAHNAANPDNQIPMKTTVLDMDIKDAIPMSNKFAEDMGIAAKKADAKDGELPAPKEPNKKQGGKIYPIGGNYYSDTPDGPAQYVKTESVVEKVLIEGDETWAYLLFEATVTKRTSGGNTVKVKTIPPKNQKKATVVAKAKEKQSKKPTKSTGGTKAAPTKKTKKFVATSEDKARLKYRKEELAKIVESGLIPTQKKKLSGAGVFVPTEKQMQALLEVTKKQIEDPEYRLPLPKYDVSEEDIDIAIETMREILKTEFSSVYNSIKKAGGVDPQLTTRDAGNQRVRDIIKKYLETGGRSAITGEFVPFNQMQLDHHVPYSSAAQRVADKKKKGIKTTLLAEQDELDSPENWDLMETPLNQLKNSLEGNALIERINKKLSASPDEKEKKELETKLKNVRRSALLTSLVTSFGNGDYSGINEETLEQFNQDEMNIICKAWNWYHPNTKDAEQFREIDPKYDEKLKERGIDTSVRHPLSITRGVRQQGGSRGRGLTKPVGELRKSFLAVVKQAGIKLMNKKDVKKTDLALAKAVRDVEAATKPYSDRMNQLKQQIKQQTSQSKK
jgi:hypothetical protein